MGRFQISNADKYTVRFLGILDDETCPFDCIADTSNTWSFSICLKSNSDLDRLLENDHDSYIKHIYNWIIKIRDDFKNNGLVLDGQITLQITECKFYKLQIIENNISCFEGKLDYTLLIFNY